MGYKVKRILVGTNLVRPSVPATAISLNKSSIALTTVGQTEQLTATLTPSGSTSTVTWTSSNTGIATVSSTGLVTCVTPGTCTITATTSNGLTATCSVTKDPFTPGADTVAYYKFNNNLNDSSGNGHNMSLYSGSITYGTASGGGKYAYFNAGWTNYWTITFNYSGNNTLSFRVHSDYDAGFALEMWTSGTSFARISAGGYFQFISPNNISGNATLGTWHLLTQTRSGSAVRCYVDGALVGTGTNSGSGSQGTRFRFNQPGDQNSSSYAGRYSMSEFIWESKTWSDTDIANYYNATKSLYGR